MCQLKRQASSLHGHHHLAADFRQSHSDLKLIAELAAKNCSNHDTDSLPIHGPRRIIFLPCIRVRLFSRKHAAGFAHIIQSLSHGIDQHHLDGIRLLHLLWRNAIAGRVEFEFADISATAMRSLVGLRYSGSGHAGLLSPAVERSIADGRLCGFNQRLKFLQVLRPCHNNSTSDNRNRFCRTGVVLRRLLKISSFFKSTFHCRVRTFLNHNVRIQAADPKGTHGCSP